MRERGDCKVFHEPFLSYYYLHLKTRKMPFLDYASIEAKTYEEIRATLIDNARTRAVFFKDMSYYVLPNILRDYAFCKRLCNVFLIRDPRRSIASYFKLDPNVSLVEIGLEAQWHHYEQLTKEFALPALVIEADALARNPRAQIARLCEFAKLSHDESAFSWKTGTTPDEWRSVEGWHTNVLASLSIREHTNDAQQVFAEVAQQAPHLKAMLAHHDVYYEKLKAHAYNTPRQPE